MALHLVIDNTAQEETEESLWASDVAYFDTVIEHTRTQLLDDLSYYQRKISDLGELDPHNRTGLLTLYRAHEQHILRLLGVIGEHLKAV